MVMRTASELVFFGFLGFIKGRTRCDRAFDDAFGKTSPQTMGSIALPS